MSVSQSRSFTKKQVVHISKYLISPLCTRDHGGPHVGLGCLAIYTLGPLFIPTPHFRSLKRDLGEGDTGPLCSFFPPFSLLFVSLVGLLWLTRVGVEVGEQALTLQLWQHSHCPPSSSLIPVPTPSSKSFPICFSIFFFASFWM